MDLFTQPDDYEQQQAKEKAALEKEHSMQETVLTIHKKYGKNSLIKGMNLKEGATTLERNNQIGGHKK